METGPWGRQGTGDFFVWTKAHQQGGRVSDEAGFKSNSPASWPHFTSSLGEAHGRCSIDGVSRDWER